MAMLSSCTTLLRPAPALTPGKSSPAAALQLRRSRQPAAPSVAALRRGPRKSRAAIFACYAQDKYNIEPSALVHPRAFASSDWSLGDDTNRITLGFNVGESTTDQELEVATTEDQTLLVIRYIDKKTSSPARSLDVRLLMPPGYDSNKMRATMLSDGWLEISIPKPKHERKRIPITPSTKTQQPTSPPTTQNP